MSGRLDGMTAVVTGGGNGIGRACCVRFAEEGADVVVADLLAEPAAETAALVHSAGGRAVTTTMDATDPEANEGLARLAIERFGRLDVAVTAAGISHAGYRSGDLEADTKWAMARLEDAEHPGRAFCELATEEFRHVLDVNLVGTLLAVQACARRMIEAGTKGRIITIASIAAKHPDAGPTAYVVSKAAVWMLTKKAARELAPSGIRVNAIGPGFIDTNMTRLFQAMPNERQQMLLAAIPLGHIGQPRDVADAALFLAGDESRYMTGEILHPDGGFFTE